MIEMIRTVRVSAPFLCTLVLPNLVSAQATEKTAAPALILEALSKVDEDTRRFNEHIVVLSSPFMEGRVPGSRGMEIAKEYMEFWFKKAGLEAPFGETAFRQPFVLSSTPKVIGSSASIDGGAALRSGDIAPHATPGGKVTAELVSVGYGIVNGRDGYTNIPEGTKLDGKIALLLRGTPNPGSGRRWRSTMRYSLQRRVQAAVAAGAAGVILVTPSYVEGDELATTRFVQRRRRGAGAGQPQVGPVLSMKRAAADTVLAAIGSGMTVDQLAKANDNTGKVEPLGSKKVTIEVKTEISRQMAENVAAMLPGHGDLATELVIIGAHLDHLGMGNFGSRSRDNKGKVVHPGADDNASGSAGVLMIADKMKAAYEKMGERPRRSVMFMGFSAEESGLNGSRFYADNPLSGYKNVLMINFDMIGRVRDNALRVSGVGTANGMQEWVKEICDKSPLTVTMNPGAGGGSDHLNFVRKGIPVLTGHSGQHGDYHTERDVSDKINRVGAAQTARLFAELGLAAAVWDASFEFQQVQTARRR